MIKIQKNTRLAPFTSMYVGGPAKFFVDVNSVEELMQAIQFAKSKKLPVFTLGRGCNVLISDSGFNGVVIKNSIRGIQKISNTTKYCEFEVGAGELWDDFVKFSVDSNLYGIENMSHVPGSVGASVVQNVGCYGQEVSETVSTVKLINLRTLKEVVFKNKEMFFSYRKSRLNDIKLDKGKCVVTHVRFRLYKRRKINMSFGDVKKYFIDHLDIKPTLKTVRKALIDIRNHKYPFPDKPEHGNNGSFWKVGVVDYKTYKKIINKLEKMGFCDKAAEMKNKKNVFKVAQGYKITPAVFIDILGYKGRKNGGAKILETHAGVINNFNGKARARDVFDLSSEVINSVYKEFGIRLLIESELVGDFD